MFPVPTRSDVEDVARRLIAKNGSTTTLEVKQELRNIGFWATQKDVSDAMAGIAARNVEFTFTDTGNHRVYEVIPFPTGNVTTFSMPNTGANGTLTPLAAARTKRAAEKFKVADWTVTDRNGQNEHDFVGVTRAQAKFNWVKETGMSFLDARTKKK